MKVKLCGIRRAEDVEYINEYKPDYAGFILSPGFRRSVTPEKFRELEGMLDGNIKRVGVFVNEPIENITGNFADKLDVIQLHGDEDAGYIKALRNIVSCEIWKAIRVKNIGDVEYADKLDVDMALFDAFSPDSYGGTGKVLNYRLINEADFSIPFFVAGGLNCGNIKDIIDKVRPEGVDISSGIETGGIKDMDKIKKIMEIVRSV